MQVIDIAVDKRDHNWGHLLLGVISASLDAKTWKDFEQYRRANPDKEHPLDSWGRARVFDRIAGKGLEAHFPNDQPYFPMVSKALECFPSLHRSPLGMLVSARYGLMFGVRAFLSGPKEKIDELALSLGWQEHGEPRTMNPCEMCPHKPCLAQCPVGAFTPQGYDYAACVNELKRQSLAADDCWRGGCLARTACPHSTPYAQEQASFHNTAVIGSTDLGRSKR